MSEQSSSNNRPAQKPGQGNRRRHHHRRRHHNRGNQGNQGSNRPDRPNQNPNQAKELRPDNRVQLSDRIYEKYQNLLEQHLIARRKYHDLFYRADPLQKNKLERLFYSSLKDLRDFETRLNPVERELFEKRNNGLAMDLTYSTLNAESLEALEPSATPGPIDPHYLQSQKEATYSEDKEESIGSKEDYEKYKLKH